MKAIPLIRELKNDKVLRSFISSTVSFIATTVFLAYNFVMGIMLRSVWNFSISFYYLLLVLLRAFILFSEKKWLNMTARERANKRILLFNRTCRMLILVDLALIVPISLMVLSQRSVKIGMIPAIATAAYTTYKVILSAVHYSRARKHENLSLYGLKIINLKDAIVSVLTLQNTMVMAFGTGNSMLPLTACTSAAMLIGMILLTALLLRKGRKFSVSVRPRRCQYHSEHQKSSQMKTKVKTV